MNRIIVALVLAWTMPARADIPSGITQRLVGFIFAGCDYFAANSPDPPTPQPSDRKLAAHFGRIVGASRDGAGIRYVLKTRALDGWDVSYWERGLDIKFPDAVAITMGDLQRLLGRDESPDVDYAVSMTSSGGTKVKLVERAFKTHREDVCRVKVRAEADEKKGPERRVFSLRFSD